MYVWLRRGRGGYLVLVWDISGTWGVLIAERKGGVGRRVNGSGTGDGEEKRVNK